MLVTVADAVATAQPNTSGLFTVNMPASQPGDILVAWLNYRIGGRFWSSVPAGWVSVATADLTSNQEIELFYKVADAIEPATYDWTLNLAHSQFNFSAVAAAVRGSDPVAPIADWDSISPNNAIAANGEIPSVTTPADSLALSGLGSRDGGTSFVPPAPWTLEENTLPSPGARLLTNTNSGPVGGEFDWAGYDSNITAAFAVGAVGPAMPIIQAALRYGLGAF